MRPEDRSEGEQMRNGIMIDAKDNVIVTVEHLKAGDTVTYLDRESGEDRTITAAEDIRIYHKLALRDIAEGEKIVKYGEHIGEADCSIPAGSHVHTHNVRSVREVLTDAAQPEDHAGSDRREENSGENGRFGNNADHESLSGAQQSAALPSFLGYGRPDGRVGVRNHVLILPTSICASDLCEKISREVKGTVSFHNQSGCSLVKGDLAWTLEVLSGYAANPNVFGTLVVSLGCETCQNDLVIEEIRKKTNKPLEHLVIQESGGTIKALEAGIRMARDLASQAGHAVKSRFPITALVVGTECGGSDPTSGLAANPLIGMVADRLVDMGATAILSETPEFIGAEHLLARRGETAAVHDRTLFIVKRFEEALFAVGEEARSGNPSPGNMAGGLTTLEEKSLGCIHKGGHRPIRAVYDYAKPVTSKGLVIMDTPGNDPSSVAGMIAGGAQIVLFSTGQGTPTGNALAPVIKLTGNRETWEKMRDNTDFDASRVIYGPETIGTLTDELLSLLIETADGQETRSELLGFTETAIARVANYV